VQVLTPSRAPKDRYQRDIRSQVWSMNRFLNSAAQLDSGNNVATAFCHSNQATGFGAEWNSLVLRM